jgi:hypothetical protein
MRGEKSASELGQTGSPNKWPAALGGWRIFGSKRASAQCGIGIVLFSKVAARQVSGAGSAATTVPRLDIIPTQTYCSENGDLPPEALTGDLAERAVPFGGAYLAVYQRAPNAGASRASKADGDRSRRDPRRVDATCRGTVGDGRAGAAEEPKDCWKRLML